MRMWTGRGHRKARLVRVDVVEFVTIGFEKKNQRICEIAIQEKVGLVNQSLGFPIYESVVGEGKLAPVTGPR